MASLSASNLESTFIYQALKANRLVLLKLLISGYLDYP